MNMKISSLPMELHCLMIQIMSVKAKDETIFTGTRLWHLKICYEWLHRSKKTTKTCSQERVKKEQCNGNGYHLGWTTRSCEVKRGQCTSTIELWEGRQGGLGFSSPWMDNWKPNSPGGLARKLTI